MLWNYDPTTYERQTFALTHQSRLVNNLLGNDMPTFVFKNGCENENNALKLPSCIRSVFVRIGFMCLAAMIGVRQPSCM